METITATLSTEMGNKATPNVDPDLISKFQLKRSYQKWANENMHLLVRQPFKFPRVHIHVFSTWISTRDSSSGYIHFGLIIKFISLVFNVLGRELPSHEGDVGILTILKEKSSIHHSNAIQTTNYSKSTKPKWPYATKWWIEWISNFIFSLGC